MLKRLCNHVSPFTHNVVTDIVKKSSSNEIASSYAHVLAKQILADLPLIPTGHLVYNLTQQIQFGLLDSVCPLEDVKNHWQECLDVAGQYLKDMGIWVTLK